MNTPNVKQVLYQKQASTLIKNFQKNGFDAYFCQTSHEAKEKALSLIPLDHIVSWGGSITLQEIGLLDAIRQRYPVLDRDQATTKEQRNDIMRQALLCDTFLMSANAISLDGTLYNIDGNGNRLAALLYGPRQVIVVAGMNKVVATIADAKQRARTIAAPLNMQRFATQTPCQHTGVCHDCLTEDSICNQFVLTRRSTPSGRIKIILVGTTLGF